MNDSAPSVERRTRLLLDLTEGPPVPAEALESLEKLYFRNERWEELFGVYEKMLDIAPGDEALSDCYARMAKLAADVASGSADVGHLT